MRGQTTTETNTPTRNHPHAETLMLWRRMAVKRPWLLFGVHPSRKTIPPTSLDRGTHFFLNQLEYIMTRLLSKVLASVSEYWRMASTYSARI